MESSDFETAPGITKKAATRYASQTPPTGLVPPPISSMARAGSTNKPDPIIADREIIITENSPNFLSRLSETASVGVSTMPNRSFGP